MKPQTTFCGLSPWAGLARGSYNVPAKEQSLAPKQKVPQTKEEARARSLEALRTSKKVAPKGENNHMSVLTSNQVRQIVSAIDRYDELKEELQHITPAALGRKYGVNEKTIRSIQKGRSWSHVTGRGK